MSTSYMTPVPADATFTNGIWGLDGTTPSNTIPITTLSKYVQRFSFDNVTEKIYFWNWLKRKGSVKTLPGESYTVPIRNANNSTFTSSTAYDEVDTTPQDILARAFFYPALITGSITLSEFDMHKNSGGPDTKALNLLEEEIRAAEAGLATTINTQLVRGVAAAGSSTNGGTIDGLDHVFRHAAQGWNTVGNVNRNNPANAYWRNNTRVINDLSTEAAGGMYQLEKAVIDCSQNSMGPNLLLCDSETFARLASEYSKIFQQQGNLSIPSEKASAANMGFHTLTWKGIEVGFDRYIQTPTAADGYGGDADVGVIYMLSSDFLKFYMVPGMDVKPMNGSGMERLTPQFVKSLLIGFAGQLVPTQMRAHCKIGIEAW